MGRRRRHFTDEYKAEIVRLIRTSTKSIGRISKEHELVESVVRCWVARAEAVEGAKQSVTSEERAELRRLRRENAQLRLERDFLKKAAAFFARESE